MADYRVPATRFLQGLGELDPRDLAVQAATGRTQQQLEDDVSLGKAEDIVQPGTPLDKAKHALASKLTARRWGTPISFLLGLGKEVADIPTTGFDPEDMRYNMIGLLQEDE
jgi:hypothetical protein